MAAIQLPLWFITDRNPDVPPPGIPCGVAYATLAFTSTATLIDFLDARESGNWKIALVAGREDLILALSDLHQSGALSICVDTNRNGFGGELVHLADIFALCDGKAISSFGFTASQAL